MRLSVQLPFESYYLGATPPQIRMNTGFLLTFCTFPEQLMFNDYLAEHPDADFVELSHRFGLPKQIASSYVEEMDTEELLHNLRIRRRILGIVTCTALIVITLWAGTVTYAIIHNERLAHGYGVLGEIEVIERVEYTEGN